MSPLHLLPLFSLFSLFSFSSAYTITLPLSPIAATPPLANTLQRLAHLAAASTARAHHLKHPKSNLSAAKVPLFPRGYGGYSIHLSFGTPPQTIPVNMDTGSSLIWFPCTRRYSCESCDFVGTNPANITAFIPKSSSSARFIACKSPKCKWVSPNARCRECHKNSTRCNRRCPPYNMRYLSGSTAGSLLSDSLVLPDNQTVQNIVVGCSSFSSKQPEGIAGFGRRPESLPAQMKLKRFSYCLASHQFDDEPVSSDLVLHSGGGCAAAIDGIKYTPFRKNPTTANPAFLHYYYVTLRRITVGGVKVKVPYKYLVPDSGGKGGTIVDSGTTFTYMEKAVFDPVEEEFEKQIGKNFSRAAAVEKESGLRPCYNISGKEEVDLPQLKFHFKGGAKMALPVMDYFALQKESVICMTLVSSEPGPGPAIIWGNYQQQDFYMEFDLENERLGFKSQVCK